ncbi:SSU ribosomal protein S3P [Borrelia anserina BA2]|uniref:SSU ribosomal protein S3P n=1 Tax=Borrelia anserina BA2 TaxID=1313293 RepID=W5SMS0_BORAN|nr:SSU ribosomal protein S3P [Borrelia anserina BA2]
MIGMMIKIKDRKSLNDDNFSKEKLEVGSKANSDFKKKNGSDV